MVATRSKAKSQRTLSNNEEYAVDKILDEKLLDGVKYYKLQWEGYDKDQASWERADALSGDSTALVQAWEDSKKSPKRGTSTSKRSTSVSTSPKRKGSTTPGGRKKRASSVTVDSPARVTRSAARSLGIAVTETSLSPKKNTRRGSVKSKVGREISTIPEEEEEEFVKTDNTKLLEVNRSASPVRTPSRSPVARPKLAVDELEALRLPPSPASQTERLSASLVRESQEYQDKMAEKFFDNFWKDNAEFKSASPSTIETASQLGTSEEEVQPVTQTRKRYFDKSDFPRFAAAAVVVGLIAFLIWPATQA